VENPCPLPVRKLARNAQNGFGFYIGLPLRHKGKGIRTLRSDSAAVLIRGVETLAAMNGLAATEGTGVWFAGSDDKRARIFRTARIGVEYAGPVWSAKKYRFVLS
jgi:3-methyladenine DNA glycosylase Mpg